MKASWLRTTVSDSLQLRFQLLVLDIQIDYLDPTLSAKLAFMHCSAEQDVAILQTLRYRVEGDGPYTVFEQGDRMQQATDASDLLHVIFRRIYVRLTERFTAAGWIVFHGGLVEVEGRHVALLGDKGAGKSTLCANLQAEGYGVQGDESMLYRNGVAIAQPRRFHLKPGTREHVDGLHELWDALPFQHSFSFKVRALDPAALGHPWRIRPVELDHLVWLEPNHDADSGLESISSLEMLRCLLMSAKQWQGERDDVVRQSTLLASRGGWRLRVGAPDTAIAQLKALVTTRGMT
ncbi:MAG: hypothetical protein AAGI11_00410 [Pseudomonadota bacterium]